jgi:oxygen-independent coproporphyrinogen-3 oxidase
MEYGLYIHIPFCKQKCPYCDFYSVPYDRISAARYIDILSKEIEKLNKKIVTVYIGGGTPTVLERELLDRLLMILAPVLSQSAENTIEANPESVDQDKYTVFLERGINRLSIGVQSLYQSKLQLLKRIHTVEEAQSAVSMAVKRGFKNISVDMIYGLPGETLESWKNELCHLVSLPVTHISCYALTCEKGTPFANAKRYIAEEVVSKMMWWNMRYLPKKDFLHYEVSNFAKQGYASRHNLNYWRNKPYFGLGASAVSYSEGVRSKNTSDLQEYIECREQGSGAVVSREKLSTLKRAQETAALNIRRVSGIELKEFKEETGYDFWSIAKRSSISYLRKCNLIQYRRKGRRIIGISLTKKGFLYADEVCAHLV